MANLLPRNGPRDAFPQLDPEQRRRFESRLRTLVSAAPSSDFLRRFERNLGVFAGLLDELENVPSLVTAFDLLDRIERVRVEVSAGTDDRGARNEGVSGPSTPPPKGGLICYWPGRSLSTGEAGVASRGFFDVLDRPPIGFWVEAIARPIDSTRERFEIAIVAWIPAEEVERASAGCRACTSGALSMLEETSKALSRQLGPILAGSSS